MTATVTPAAEVRRLRAERDELARLVAEHLAADPGPTVALELARQWAHDAGERRYADGYEAGRLAVLAEHKATLHAIHDLWDDHGPIWAMHAAALRRSA